MTEVTYYILFILTLITLYNIIYILFYSSIDYNTLNYITLHEVNGEILNHERSVDN